MHRFLIGRLRLLCGVLALYLLFAPAFAGVSYTVKSGDTLSKLAKRFSVSLDKLIETNHITNANCIDVGQILEIPGTDTVPVAEKPPTARPELASRSINPRELAEARTRLIAQQGDVLLGEAKQYLGTPYLWGGLGSRGIDCSGLIVRSMEALGKKVPRCSADMFKAGEKVTYEELMPGDLVFFNTRGNGVSHVGMWAGNNHFIHSSSSRGVIISKLEGYYSKRLVGARRIRK